MSRPIASSSRSILTHLTPTSLLVRTPTKRSVKPTHGSYRTASTDPWPSRTHLRKPPTIPAPLPATYPQKVVLSDGSTFTAYTTAPTPAIIRLTRDVTNNPLWAPGTDTRGVGEGVEEGRVGRFRRRFGGDQSQAGTQGEEGVEAQRDGEEGAVESHEMDAAPQVGKRTETFGLGDFDWMSEGAKEEKIGAKDVGGGKGKGKK